MLSTGVSSVRLCAPKAAGASDHARGAPTGPAAKRVFPRGNGWHKGPQRPQADSPRPSAGEVQRALHVCGASSSLVGTGSASSDSQEGLPSSLACPICFRPFPRGMQLRCGSCARSFPSGGIVDLVVSSGAASAFTESAQLSQSVFENSLVASAYDRGWRQTFGLMGFPGPEGEFEMALRYLEPARGGTVVDVSCGSGIFTRPLAASGAFSQVIASDYSAAMLHQTREFLAQSPPVTAHVPFVRADVGRLPFATGSIDAIHAGAALHCWPSPTAAASEISRVLRPGGVFVASTFLQPAARLEEVLGDAAAAPIAAALERTGLSMGNVFSAKLWTEQELRALCEMVGLGQFERERQAQFILFRAVKGPFA